MYSRESGMGNCFFQASARDGSFTAIATGLIIPLSGSAIKTSAFGNKRRPLCTIASNTG